MSLPYIPLQLVLLKLTSHYLQDLVLTLICTVLLSHWYLC